MISGSSLIKCTRRRTKREMDSLRGGLYELARDNQPLTIRQLFYRAVAVGLIEKTQREYKNVVSRLAGQMREGRELPFEWIVDNTRWMRKPNTYTSLDAMLHESARCYRRDLWVNQDAYVEIWCESDSIAGVLYPVTEEFDVPLMPCGGQPSKTFLHNAAESMAYQDRPCFVYYFGDYDRAGFHISDRVNRDLQRYLTRLSDSPIEFAYERVAVNEDQIGEFDLPTRPPKDKRGGWTDDTVELEAMTTPQIQGICRECIEQHIDPWRLRRTQEIEQLERETLLRMAEGMES